MSPGVEHQSQGGQARLSTSRGARPLPVTTARPIVEPELLEVRLVSEEDLDTTTLAREFPTIVVTTTREETANAGLVIDDFAWRGSFDFSRFDDAAAARPLGTLTVRGDDSAGVACEVLARYQRFIARRNAASTSRVFDEVLRRHAALYDVSKPLVQDELDHALDTWQWLLRLDPEVSLAAQVAALFHDVDRLDKDVQEKLEHRALTQLVAMKDIKSASGGRANVERPWGSASPAEPAGGRTVTPRDRVRHLLVECGVAGDDVAHTFDVLDGHEDRAREAGLLDEADALSFLSLESFRYADHFGLAQTRRKVLHTVGRLGAGRATEAMRLIRLRPDVDRLLRS